MFKKEAEEYADEKYGTIETEDKMFCRIDWQRGAEHGYNKGYHDAEEHYLNVIDNQHKLVDESKKKDFRKCMKCTDGTYQSGFKDGYNKANEWHYVKDGDLPKDEKLCLIWCGEKDFNTAEYVRERFWDLCGGWLEVDEVIAWKEIVLPELKESE